MTDEPGSGSLDPKSRPMVGSVGQLRCLALLLLVALGCVPAAAQCDAYIAQYKSGTVWVVNTLSDAVSLTRFLIER